MGRRSRTEIDIGILEVVNEGISNGGNNGDGLKKTTIMQRAFLSYSQLKEYLKILIDNNLISYDLKTMRFKTTEKGFRVIEAYSHLDQLIPDKQKQPEQLSTKVSTNNRIRLWHY
jgi:predicted transcriptional regulator